MGDAGPFAEFFRPELHAVRAAAPLRGREVVSFVHKSIQEFFVALAVRAAVADGLRQAGLTPRVLAELAWLAEVVPIGYATWDDRELRDVYLMIPDTSEFPLSLVASGILTELKERGSEASIRALEQIRAETPDSDWLGFTIAEARRIGSREAWTPPAPGDVRRMLQDSCARLVRGGAELLALLEEELATWQRKLAGADRDVEILWKPSPRKPQLEKSLQMSLRRALRDQLEARRHTFLVTREAETSPRVVELAAEQPDFLVAALGDGEWSQVLIEVKRSGHREVLTAMETQLVDRYLATSDFNHGLYVVFWFPGHSHPKLRSADDARRYFAAQARGLARSRGVDVRAFVVDGSLPTT